MAELLLANSFPTATRELIPKRVFSVNTAVVQCSKKPDRMANTTVGLLSSFGVADCQGGLVNPPAPI